MMFSARFVRWAFATVSSGLMFACGSVPSSKADANGGGDGNGGGGVCEPSAALRCDDKTLVSCNAEGTAEVQTQCALRCNAATPACEDKIAPSNGYAAQLDDAATGPAINITSNTIIDRDDFTPATGMVKIGNQQAKAVVVPGSNGGLDVLVISVASLNIAANAQLGVLYPDYNSGIVNFRGPVAIMSAGDVTIAGTVYVFPDGDAASDSCVGSNTNGAGADNEVIGAGGGGFGRPGGNGGGVSQIATGGVGGPMGGNAMLIPLRGGCRGGRPAYPLTLPGEGGGALQITSATRIDIAATGKVGAPGNGGYVSAGGGSGGGILLEAPTVSLSGGIYANGGAGGCSEANSGNEGLGLLAMAPATRGPCGSRSVSGGNGGFGTTAAGDGTALTNQSGIQDFTGGGGGAVGRVRINTLDMTITGSGEQSPPVSLGAIATR